MLMDCVEDSKRSEFYPTPENLVNKMIEGIDWNLVNTILEPSAGKGDILKGVAKATSNKYNTPDVDCIEIDKNLRQILKYQFSGEHMRDIDSEWNKISSRYGTFVRKSFGGQYFFYDKGKEVCITGEDEGTLKILDSKKKEFFSDGIHIVHDDFLSYKAYKEYDLILMNPPFSNGDKHLLKALDIQKNGGSIVCLLNAETIRNPYTETRKHLAKLLKQYNASIEYVENAFADAEREAKVDVAIIKVTVPKTDKEPSIFEKIASKREYEEPEISTSSEIEISDFIKAIVARYQVEIESGIELIKTYTRMIPHLSSTFEDGSPIIALTGGYSKENMTVNRYVKAVRGKYWKALLTNKKFVGKLTSSLQNEYQTKVSSFADYDFSEFNIQVLAAEINSQVKRGIEDEIVKMYDKLTEEHSYYPECSKNRYLYSGWKTNIAWKLGKKSILPCYGVFSGWNGEPRTYEAYHTLSDIERIFNFLDGNMTADVDLQDTIHNYFSRGITKNIPCKFFNVTFFKKGTVHLTFTCPELIDKYNIYAAQNRGWLPPSYGKKKYTELTEEEKSVIDSFQGKDAYDKVISKADFYLASPIGNTVPLLSIA